MMMEIDSCSGWCWYVVELPAPQNKVDGRGSQQLMFVASWS